MSMPRYLGVKCKCGGELRYYYTAVDGMAAYHCNKCGWMHTTNEPWDPARHGRIEENTNSVNKKGARHPLARLGFLLGASLFIVFLGMQIMSSYAEHKEKVQEQHRQALLLSDSKKITKTLGAFSWAWNPDGSQSKPRWSATRKEYKYALSVKIYDVGLQYNIKSSDLAGSITTREYIWYGHLSNVSSYYDSATKLYKLELYIVKGRYNWQRGKKTWSTRNKNDFELQRDSINNALINWKRKYSGLRPVF